MSLSEAAREGEESGLGGSEVNLEYIMDADLSEAIEASEYRYF